MKANPIWVAAPRRGEVLAQSLFPALVLGCALLWAAVAFSAPAGGDYVITRSTIDGGGGRATGGDFVLTGTIGQPDAQPGGAHGSGYSLAGGFWAQATEILELIFKDGFESP